jgi:hypothetical protein
MEIWSELDQQQRQTGKFAAYSKFSASLQVFAGVDLSWHKFNASLQVFAGVDLSFSQNAGARRSSKCWAQPFLVAMEASVKYIGHKAYIFELSRHQNVCFGGLLY